jgi:hypothetical protein
VHVRPAIEETDLGSIAPLIVIVADMHGHMEILNESEASVLRSFPPYPALGGRPPRSTRPAKPLDAEP